MGETKRVVLEWRHQLEFVGSGAGGVPVTIDGDNAASTGPMETLLLALAACTGGDIVSILEKKRVQLVSFEVDVAGDRREEYPRCYVAIRLRFRFKATGLSEDAARQAIDLSLEKYCSVRHSLDPAIPVGYELVIEAA